MGQVSRFVLVVTLTTLGVLSAGGCGGSSGTAVTPTPPGPAPLNLTTFQSADMVIGQVDFTGSMPNQGGALGAAGFERPASPAAGGLYVPDPDNHRILGFNTAPTTPGASADFVLGQTDFTSGSSGTSATEFTSPDDACVADGRLFVADRNNSRVLIWNTLPTSGAPADVVLGQTTFLTSASGLSSTALAQPGGCCAAGGRLVVADTGNHRVLIWNSIPTTNGAAADLVLGQPDFVSGAANRGGTTAADTLHAPVAVWTDGTRLAVVDFFNRRVLVWTSFPTTNGQAADLVVGQPDLTSGGSALSATGLGAPYDVCSNGFELFVADGGNHRVMVWNTFPVTNGQPADVVLGQGDFTHGTENDDNQDGVPDAAPSARTLDAGGASLFLCVSDTQLFVADRDNHRVLIFSGN